MGRRPSHAAYHATADSSDAYIGSANPQKRLVDGIPHFNYGVSHHGTINIIPPTPSARTIMTPYTHNQFTRTTFRVDNLHCPTCVATIADIVTGHPLLEELEGVDTKTPAISDVDISLEDRSVSFTHRHDFDLKLIMKQLDASGFDVSPPSSTNAPTKTPSIFKWRSFLPSNPGRDEKSSRRQMTHREICGVCRASESSNGDTDVVSDGIEKPALQESRFALEGMTCR